MSKKWLSLIIVLVSFWLGSCAPSGNNTANNPSPPPTKEATQPEAQPEPETPTEITETEVPRVAVSGLRPPTDPDTRIQKISRGLSDPFSPLPPKPEITVVEEPTSPEGPEVGVIPAPPSEVPASEPEVPTSPQETSPANIEPNTELARSVIISGIVTLGDTPKVILTAPKENFARYVEVGQYISEGKVLVKRIEEGDNNKLFVVLEQSGVEVRRPVGNDEPSVSL